MAEVVHAGDLDKYVERFGKDYAESSTGERVETEVSKGKIKVKRIDGSGKEDEEGRLIPLKVCRFICRFSIERLENIRKDYLRDIDGDYHVIDVSIYGQGRNRFLELKARLRGED